MSDESVYDRTRREGDFLTNASHTQYPNRDHPIGDFLGLPHGHHNPLWDVGAFGANVHTGIEGIGLLSAAGVLPHIPHALHQPLHGAGKWLSPLAVLMGGHEMYEGVHEAFGKDGDISGLGKILLGGAEVTAGAAGTTAVAGTIAGSFGATGLAATLGSAGTLGAGGLVGGSGVAGALAPASLVAGAGLAGYGAGRLLDNGADWIGDKITGNAQGDHSISGLLADGMTAVDQATCGDDYRNSVGYRLAGVTDDVSGWWSEHLSDARLKTNIVDIEGALAMIGAL